MKERYFIFNGINSLEKKIILKEHPIITSPQLRDDGIVIDGRSGKLHYDQEIYDSFVRTLECTIIDPSIDIRSISSWLKGFGKIIFSNELDKFYKVNIVNQIDFTNIADRIHEFPLTLEFEPFAYEIAETLIELTNESGFEIRNSNTSIYPKIKVFGSGDVSLNINNQSIIIYNIEDYIELDCELELAYKDTENKNQSIYGEYLKLIPGKNEISYTGKVDKIEITYRGTYI